MEGVLFCVLLLAFAVAMYIFLDGFSLGQGILYLWAPSDDDRDIMMSSIAPFWDGNTTWLIYGGSILFGAFPLAFSILLTAFYVPILTMVIALLFRGVSFEFRLKETKYRSLWDKNFFLGSTIASFCQGSILGAIVEGIPIEQNEFSGYMMGWLTPFSTLTGLGVVVAYGFVGSTWIMMKTTGKTREWAQEVSRPLMFLTVLFMLSVSCVVAIKSPYVFQKWLQYKICFFVLLSGIVCTLYKINAGIESSNQQQSFSYTIVLYALYFLAIGFSLYPYIVIPTLSFEQAASPASSIEFMMVVSLISLPMILGYSLFVFSLYKGKSHLLTGYK